MTRVTEKEGIDAAQLGIRVGDGCRMDSVDLAYAGYNGGKQNHLSIRMNYADYNTGAVPLVDLIKYAMQFHPELLDEAAQALKTDAALPSVADLLLELPALPGFKMLVDEVTALPAPSPEDGRERLLLKEQDVADAVSASTGYSNMHHYVVVIPSADEVKAGQDIVIEGRGHGMSDTSYEKYAFSNLLPGAKNQVRNEVMRAAQRAA